MRPLLSLRATLTTLAVALLAVAGATVGAAPAQAHGDRDHGEQRLELEALPDVPLLTSPNVKQLSANPGQVGISGCFLRSAPLFVTSGLDSLRVYDVSDGARPELVGTLVSAQFENEAMTCGERRTRQGTERFALVGVDLYQASPDDLQHTNVGGNELIVVDVTDPAAPRIRSRVPGTTSTHTVACLDENHCDYAYSAGNGGEFSVFDLRDLDNPREVDADAGVPGVQPFTSPTAGHKWNFDAADVGTHTGFGGSSMWDVSRPQQPRLITTTGAAGAGTDPAYPGYNDFIHHNSFRPNAAAFRPDAPPSLANGNVLLVTEEDYEETDCAQAGSFQTWWVKRLDGTPDAIVPLDKVELADLGTYPLPRGAFCSAHWFDFHESGIVAVGFYGGGTQLVDVRNPLDLTSYGHAVQGASEVWDAVWLPVYDRNGRRTGKSTNLVYSVDLVRGLDVYAVDLPGTSASTSVTGENAGLGASTVPLGVVGSAVLVGVGLRRRSRRD